MNRVCVDNILILAPVSSTMLSLGAAMVRRNSPFSNRLVRPFITVRGSWVRQSCLGIAANLQTPPPVKLDRLEICNIMSNVKEGLQHQ